jgi:hypothetical protein
MIDSRRVACFAGSVAAPRLFACLCAGAILFTAALALAQQQPKPPPAATAAPQSLAPPAETPGFFASFSQWWNDQTANFKSALQDTGSKVQNLGQDAGNAAKTSVEAAKDAAGAVVRIPSTRLVSGNEKCAVAPNGGPDCAAAAAALCKAKGFASGTSAGTTAAEICKPEVYLAGRSRGPGCQTETFVSSALCQ